MSKNSLEQKYLVEWSIETFTSGTPYGAAKEAWSAMQASDSVANVFTVTERATGRRYRVNLYARSIIAAPPDCELSSMSLADLSALRKLLIGQGWPSGYAGGDSAEAAYKRVRDELQKRIESMFGIPAVLT